MREPRMPRTGGKCALAPRLTRDGLLDGCPYWSATEAANRDEPTRDNVRPNRRKPIPACDSSHLGGSYDLRPTAVPDPRHSASARFRVQLPRRGP